MATGSLPPIPGLFAGWVDVPLTVAYFSAPNTLTEVTFRLGVPASGGTVTVELNTQSDGLGDQISVVIADGADIGTGTGNVTITAGSYLYQIITAEPSTNAENLSGDYTVSQTSGVTTLMTSLSRMKADLGVTSTDATRDLLFNYIMAGVSSRMQNYMDRKIIQQTTTAERIDSIGDIYVQTHHYPIISVSALTENTTALTEGTGFEMKELDLEIGRIVRIADTDGTPTSWASGKRVVTLTYINGFAYVPEDLIGVATSLSVNAYHESESSGRGWRGLGAKGVDPSSSVSFDKDLWVREAVPVLDRYRRMVA